MADEDPKHLAYLRGLPCCVRTIVIAPSRKESVGPLPSCVLDGLVPFDAESIDCKGTVAPHHSTHGRGKGQRSHDHEAMPLCMKHHFEFHAGLGHFADWTHEQRTKWQAEMVAIYRPKDDPEVF